MKLLLKKPDYRYIDALIDMSKDYIQNKEPFYNFKNVDDAYKRIDNDKDYEIGIVPVGNLPGFTFWFFLNDIFVGTSRLRPILNERFNQKGGNIGYDVRPSYRKKGIGTEVLRITMNKAKEIGLKKVLITCDDSNIGSIKVIEKNGGKLINIIDFEEEKSIIRRYEVDLV
jgi:predicted acetyltransferase